LRDPPATAGGTDLRRAESQLAISAFMDYDKITVKANLFRKEERADA